MTRLSAEQKRRQNTAAFVLLAVAGVLWIVIFANNPGRQGMVFVGFLLILGGLAGAGWQHEKRPRADESEPPALSG